MPGVAYRCAACAAEPNRCAACRARRAAADRLRRASKRAEGTCTECHRKALPDQSRCKRHRAANNERSGAAHVAARKRAS